MSGTANVWAKRVFRVMPQVEILRVAKGSGFKDPWA